MEISYAITPFITWLVAGALKFIINSIRERKLAFGLIGYGGLPSNHSAIVSGMVALIGLNEGISHPSFGIALTLAFIVILDASSLRRQIGRHASAINRLSAETSFRTMLRERMGHTRMEIAAGILVGILVAFAVSRVFV